MPLKPRKFLLHLLMHLFILYH